MWTSPWHPVVTVTDPVGEERWYEGYRASDPLPVILYVNEPNHILYLCQDLMGAIFKKVSNLTKF